MQLYNKVVIVYQFIDGTANLLPILLNGNKLGLAITNSINTNDLYMTWMLTPNRYEYYISDRFDLSTVYQLYNNDRYELYNSLEETYRRIRELPNAANTYILVHTFDNDKPIATTTCIQSVDYL